MKILVVDDNDVNVRLLVSMLTRKKYDVLSANNGFDAIEIFKQHLPEMVLMDIMMPGMDGRKCASELKQIAGDTYVPIIYVTALSQEAELSTALAAGGDDFVSKPINFDILLSKINAHRRIYELNAELAQKNRELAKYNLSLERDQALASHYFERALKHSYLDPGVIRHHLTAAKAFNGDLLMAAPRPGGGLYLILGDFTGHGLGASIGSLPVSQIFFNMSKNRCWIGDIARELNRELRNLLPDDMFLAATLVELNATGERLEIWTGGLPEAYLIDVQDHTQRIIQSMHPPLAILNDESFNPATCSFNVRHGERLYLYTDGFIEAKNLHGEGYGNIRLKELFQHHGNDAFDRIIDDIQAFIGHEKRTDDTSFVELTCRPVNGTQPAQANQELLEHAQVAIAYSLDITLTDSDLKNEVDVVSYVSDMICTTTLAPYKGIIHTIIGEIYSNMLEHGLLNLDSNLKCDDEGFIEYYEKRKTALMCAKDLSLEINIRFQPHTSNDKLVITMSHNGNPQANFDQSQTDELNTRPCGRGMLLLKNLCENITVFDGGRKVQAVYRG